MFTDNERPRKSSRELESFSTHCIPFISVHFNVKKKPTQQLNKKVRKPEIFYSNTFYVSNIFQCFSVKCGLQHFDHNVFL